MAKPMGLRSAPLLVTLLVSHLTSAEGAVPEVPAAAPPSSAAAASSSESTAPSTGASSAVGAASESTSAPTPSSAVAPADTVPAAAVATEPAAVQPAEAAAPEEQGDKKKRKDKKGKKDKGDDGADGKDGGDDDDKPVWEKKPKIEVGGLLHAQFNINDVPDASKYDFRLANARIYLEWRQGSLLDAVGEVELSRDGDRDATSWAPMRDAFVRVSPDRAFRMRMGQFKRPFGRLALTSLRNLKLVNRGISDVWVNEELHYGERDVGFQVEGEIGKGLELYYAFGMFNGQGRNHRDNDPNGAKDFVGRVEGRLGKHLSVGVNTANKRFDTSLQENREDQLPESAWMSGADIEVDIAGFYGLVEGQYGSNYESVERYHSASFLTLLAYKIPITDFWQMAVEPLVKGEILKTATEVSGRRVLNGTAGANLYVGRIFRLMVQGEWIKPSGLLPDNLGEGEEQKRLIIQAGMYTR